LIGLTKNCAVCGIDIDKQVKFKKFGKYFYSGDDASAKYHREPTPVKTVRLGWAVHAANKS
jgi:hypothetical protein